MDSIPFATAGSAKQIWVIAASFNEEEVISKFIERMYLVQEVHTLVIVDDGSKDQTVKKIRELIAKNILEEVSCKLILLELTRNFGKEAAMLAGLDIV